MLTDDDIRDRLRDLEADNVERTRSAAKSTKLGEAICAFANDLPSRRQPGVLIVGVNDDGSCAGTPIDEQLVQTLLGFRTDGTVTPFPVMTVSVREIDGCRMAVVEVEPSENPPVRFQGRTCIRIGPRRGYATPEEERRLTEKRRWGSLPFDQQPVQGSGITDLDLFRFREEYLPSVVHPDVLAENRRSTEEQLRALRLISRNDVPTAAGLLLCGKDPRAWLPGAYIQFVRYPGTEIGDIIQDQREIGGPLADQMRRLDELINVHTAHRSDLSRPRQIDRPTYPTIALQELMRNAVIHRTYEGTAAPVRILWFADRVEITSPGGTYGAVTLESFGTPGPVDYRNPALADAAKAMGFVQKFGSGIPRALRALRENGNPLPRFQAEPTYVNVTIQAAP